MEVWKDVINYKGYYEVSDLGNVRSVDRYVSSGAFRVGLPIKEYIKNEGYSYVTLRRDGKKKNFKVHQLVVYSFFGLPPKWKEIDHKNTIKTDNKLSNLRVVTHAENANNPITRRNMSKGQLKNSSQRGKFGSKHPAARAVIGINKDGHKVEYAAICEAEKDGFTAKNISAVLGGFRQHHRGYVFNYKKL